MLKIYIKNTAHFVVLFIILIINFVGTDLMAQNKTHNSTIKDVNIYKYSVKNIKKEDFSLKKFEGKVLLIVNVASECGYTPQYAGLEKIYRKYKAKGFEILAFPCNDFGMQEPGTNEEIQKFCSSNFDVTFSLFDKIEVKGSGKSELYKMLTNNSVTGKSEIGWNFEKFLVDKKGNVVKNFKSKVTPESEELTSEIEKLLN
jgi:glutathione peroxidase